MSRVTYRPTIKFLAIDTETTGLFGRHGCRAFAISTCDNNGTTNYFEAKVDPQTRTPIWKSSVLQDAYDLITSYSTVVFHNLNFDLFMLSLLPGKHWRDFPATMETNQRFHDTWVRAHVLNSRESHGLKDQALLHCDILDNDEKQLDDTIKSLRREFKSKYPNIRLADKGDPKLAGQKDRFHKCDFWLTQLLPNSDPRKELCKVYAVKDAVRTAALFIRQEQTFKNHPEFLKPYRIQHSVMLPIYRMSRCGVSINRKNFNVAFIEADKVRTEQLDTMRSILKHDFNPNSGPQLKNALFNTLKFKSVKYTKAGNDSTDKSVLPELRNQKVSSKAKQFLEAIIAYREVNSAYTYMQSYNRFEIGNKLYPSLKQCGTASTRLASEQPNGQNIGKGKERIDENGNIITVYQIRKIFGPPSTNIWSSIDYDQLQLRIFAYWSKDPKLIKAFEDGFDFHNYMAMQIFETSEPTKIQRRIAKNVNFGYIFGAGERKIDATCGMPGIFRRVQALFPCVTESINRTVSFVKQYGYIETASGYRLHVDRNKAYAGVNYIVQGTEGDIVKTALANCDRYLLQSKLLENYSPIQSLKDKVEKWADSEQHNKVCMILQVHDELLFSLQKNLGRAKIIKVLTDLSKIMQNAGLKFGVPCICKPEIIENNWSEAIKLQDWGTNGRH